jgi:hypothetical protein
MKLRKIFSRILLYSLAVLMIGLMVRAYFNFRMGNRLEAYIGDRQADGVPLSRKALMPDCSEAENGANLWRAAEALFPREGVNVALLRDTMEAIFNRKPLEPDIREELKKTITDHPRVFQFMEESSEKPCFRYGDWKKDMHDIRIPDSVKMINAIRLLGIDAIFKAEEGNIREAIDQIRWAMRFIHRVMDEPLLITTLVAVANMKYLLVCLNQITDGRDIDSEVLNTIIQELDPELWRNRFVRGLQGERIFFLEAALRVLEGDRTVFNSSLAESVFFWLIRPVTKAEILWALKRSEEAESAFALPFYQTEEFRTRHSQDLDSVPWYYPLVKNLSPSLSATFLKEAILEALMETGQIGMACKIYKNLGGRFPDEISELVPDILAKEPVDPFTGKPFIYRLQEDGFVVYSVGSNEKDDDGRGTFQVDRMVMEKDDDWPWREKTK